jgi:hypothetical protein
MKGILHHIQLDLFADLDTFFEAGGVNIADSFEELLKAAAEADGPDTTP